MMSLALFRNQAPRTRDIPSLYLDQKIDYRNRGFPWIPSLPLDKKQDNSADL
jgi:hypothetical protein